MKTNGISLRILLKGIYILLSVSFICFFVVYITSIFKNQLWFFLFASVGLLLSFILLMVAFYIQGKYHRVLKSGKRDDSENEIEDNNIISQD